MQDFMVSRNENFYEINWTCYFIMLTLANQITGYFNLKVNQRLFRFILTKIKLKGGRTLDFVIFFVTEKILNWKKTLKEDFSKLKSN